MKRNGIAVTMVCLLLVIGLYSPSYAGGLIHLGLASASQEVTDANPNPNQGTTTEAGITVGLGIDHFFSPKIGLRFDAAYIKKIPEYLSFDALALFAFPSRSTVKPYLAAGLRLDVELSISGIGPFPPQPPPAGYTHHEVIYGATVGGGVDFKLNKKSSLQLEVQYQPDFVDVVESPTLTIHNSAVLVMATYRVAFEGR